MAGVYPALHVLWAWIEQSLDARHKAGHDEEGVRDRLEQRVARVN
jgi:hypothetical protein